MNPMASTIAIAILSPLINVVYFEWLSPRD